MKEALLRRLACPRCAHPLDLHEARRESPAQGLAEEVRSGVLRCLGCGGAYPVEEYVPDLRVEPAPRQASTVRHYSALWRLSEPSSGTAAAGPPLPDRAAHRPHAAVVDEALGLSRLAPSHVLDGGCGDGSDLLWLGMAFPAAEVVGLDLSEGVHVARRRALTLANVHLVRGSVLQPPLSPDAFDLVYSYGVLHHTPDPASGFRALAQRLAPGGRMVIYVYTDLMEEPLLRWVLAPVGLLRRLTRRLSPAGLALLARLLSPSVFLSFGLPAAALRALGRRALADRLPFNWVDRPQGAYGDLFDRLGAEYEWRHSAAEVRAWFASSRLEDVSVSRMGDRRGWLAHGERPGA